MNERRPDDPPVSLEPDLVEAVLDQVRHDRVAARADAHGTGHHQRLDRLDPGGDHLSPARDAAPVGCRVRGRIPIGCGARPSTTSVGRGPSSDPTSTNRCHCSRADQQVVAAAAFRHLVTPTGSKIALAVEDLAELTELPAADLTTVVDRLAAPDLHILRRVTAPESTELVRHEIFHDALARPISDWRRRFTAHRDHELLEAKVEAERIQKEQAQAESEVATARAAHERKRRKRAVMGLVVAVALLVISLVAGAVVLRAALPREQRSGRGDVERGSNRRDGEPELSDVSGWTGRDRVAGALTHVRSSQQCVDGSPGERCAAGPRIRSPSAPSRSVHVPRRRRARLGRIGRHRQDVGSATGRTSPRTGSTTRASDDAIAALAVAEHDGRSLLAGRPERPADEQGTVDVWDVTDPAISASTVLRPRRCDRAGGRHEARTRERRDRVGRVDERAESASLTALAVSPDGSEVAIGHDDGTVDVATFGHRTDVARRRTPLAEDLGSVNALAYRADGQAIAVATSSGVAMVDTHPVAPVAPRWLATDGGGVSAVAFAPDGSVCWADSDSIDVQPPTGAAISRLGSDRRQRCTRSPSTQRAIELVAGGDDSSVTVWDLATGEVVGPPRTLPSGPPVRTVAVSPSGDRIAAAGDDGIVRQWPTDQTYGRTTAAMTLPTTDGPAGVPADSATSAVWSPDRTIGSRPPKVKAER